MNPLKTTPPELFKKEIWENHKGRWMRYHDSVMEKLFSDIFNQGFNLALKMAEEKAKDMIDSDTDQDGDSVAAGIRSLRQ